VPIPFDSLAYSDSYLHFSLHLKVSTKNLNDNKIGLPSILLPQSDSNHSEPNFVVENFTAFKKSCLKP